MLAVDELAHVASAAVLRMCTCSAPSPTVPRRRHHPSPRLLFRRYVRAVEHEIVREGDSLGEYRGSAPVFFAAAAAKTAAHGLLQLASQMKGVQKAAL